MKIKLPIGKNNAAHGLSVLFLLVCFLLNSGYAYNLVTDTPTIICLFLCSFSMLTYYGVSHSVLHRRDFWGHPFILLSIVIFLVMLIHMDFNAWGSYFRQILVLVTAVLVCMEIKLEDFSRILIQFMIFVTVLAIFMWVLINIMKIVLPLPIMKGTATNVYYNEYYNGILFFINTYTPIRLMGPFWEPGVYASMALLALLLQMGVEQQGYLRGNNIWVTLILSAGILLSLSTAGYILLGIVFIIKVINSVKKQHAILITILLLLAFCFFYLYIDEILNALNNWMPNVFNKLTFSSFSKSTRINGPLLDLKIFIEHIMFGSGMSQYQAEWPILAARMNVESRTSTITYFLANYGALGVLYVLAIARGVFRQKNIFLPVRFCFFVILASIVTKEPHYVNLCSSTIIAYLNVSYLNISSKGNRNESY